MNAFTIANRANDFAILPGLLVTGMKSPHVLLQNKTVRLHRNTPEIQGALIREAHFTKLGELVKPDEKSAHAQGVIVRVATRLPIEVLKTGVVDTVVQDTNREGTIFTTLLVIKPATVVKLALLDGSTRYLGYFQGTLAYLDSDQVIAYLTA